MYLDVTSRSKWVGEPDYIIPAYVEMEDEVEDDEDDDNNSLFISPPALTLHSRTIRC